MSARDQLSKAEYDYVYPLVRQFMKEFQCDDGAALESKLSPTDFNLVAEGCSKEAIAAVHDFIYEAEKYPE